jgi:hypothetical protein
MSCCVRCRSGYREGLGAKIAIHDPESLSALPEGPFAIRAMGSGSRLAEYTSGARRRRQHEGGPEPLSLLLDHSDGQITLSDEGSLSATPTFW